MNSDRKVPVATLYVVATPIGNLKDMSARSIEILKSVDIIAAEDTRHTRPLLQHFGISTRVVAHHAHNEACSTEGLVEQLRCGQSVALVSDAGTPLISDPGERVVKAAIQAGVNVVPVPGACAAIAALSVAGLDTCRFSFFGFVPSSQRAKTEWLEEVVESGVTTIFYESPHRLKNTLVQMEERLRGLGAGSDRNLVIAREMTKQYETLYYGSVAELAAAATDERVKIKGEFVLLLEGLTEYRRRIGQDAPATDQMSAEEETWMSLLSEVLPKKQVSQLLAKRYNKPKRFYYQKLLER